MKNQPRRQYSYLLRVWQVEDQEKPIWRALVKDAFTDQQTGFASIEELCDFLKQLSEPSPQPDDAQIIE